MKTLSLPLILFLFLIGCFSFSCQPDKSGEREKKIAELLITQTDSIESVGVQLLLELNSQQREHELQQLFSRLRSSYKVVEWATEYFDPATSRFVNGPPVEEVEAASHRVSAPAGLQVMEPFIFPHYYKSANTELIRQVNLLRRNCEQFKLHFAQIALFDWQVFDAAKLEIYRIMTLGIAGFDTPVTLQGIPESAAALHGVMEVLSFYLEHQDRKEANDLFTSAIHYLNEHADFNAFNRAEFITSYCNQITAAMSDWEAHLKMKVIKYNRLLNQDARTLFDDNAININAYAPDQSSFLTDAKVRLGRELFSDPVLSGNGKRSCRSCHQPEKAFTDGLAKNTVIGKTDLLQRNTPTLINAALQPAQFYDLRVKTLEDQSLDVVQSNVEMHGSMKISVALLWQNKRYRQLFSEAFPRNNRTGIDTLEIMNAIGSYIRSLSSLNSRFDEYMRGNRMALKQEEIKGFNLFMGKAKCGTCHYMPLFNGTLPPRFVRIETEIIGVPRSARDNRIDGDPGRYSVIRVESLKHSFKVPTLRNASLTAPYMHNGIFSTLMQVMEFYNKGGGHGLGQTGTHQTLPEDGLNLSREEMKTLISFIASLNSR